MALEKKKFSEIPSDAIILSEDDAFHYHNKILRSWKNSLEVFPIKYGAFIAGGSCILSSIYLNNYFRTKLKLLHYGRMTSYLPICVIPSAVAFFFHHELVLKDLILLKQKTCPVCIELRATAVQAMIGCVMPLILAPMSSFSYAHKFGTYDLPYITKEPLEVFKLVQKQIKPIKNIIIGIFIGHALLGSVITYLEARSIYKIDFRLSELEKELELSDKI